MKQEMHPRNIYNKPQNFKDLGHKYPEFAKHLKTDLTGRLTLDFQNADSVRAYSKTLLQKDFNLNVNIPPNTLIPTIPLRLNYILWIEDLLSLAGIYEGARGIDIGTGASCVYPLMIARKNEWKMIATEIDVESVNAAKENVTQNGLDNSITVKQVTGDTLLKELFDEDRMEYDFCMCNPPFFGAIHELNSIIKARKLSRPKPRNAFCASASEVITDGGEVEFITKLIRESMNYKFRIKIFSTMVGVKANLKVIKRVLLEESAITSFKETAFFQGHTTRWGLAWTFTEIGLTKAPNYDKDPIKRKKPFSYILKPFNSTIENASFKLERIFKELQMKYKVLQQSSDRVIYNIIANSDTWSHNRRKRREQERLKRALFNNAVTQENEAGFDDSQMEDLNYNAHSSEDVEMSECSNSLKRKFEISENDEHNSKRTREFDAEKESIFLEFTVFLRTQNEALHIEMGWATGVSGVDSLHQVLQYVKNHLKFE